MKLTLVKISLVATIALIGCGGSGASDKEREENSNSHTLSTHTDSSSTSTENQSSDGDSTSLNIRPSIDSESSSANANSSTTDRETQNSNNDTTPPVITISGDNPLEVIQGKTFTDPSATATDNIDGEVTVTSSGRVDTSTIGEYPITYTARDQVGNEATATRIVKVKAPISNDKTAPVITISGENPLSIFQGATFSDPGATATDNIDGEVAVTPSGSVDMSTVGEYTITYTAKDQTGNEATATRTVKVKSAEVIWNVSNVTEFRQALEDASANGENDKIVLSTGTYKTTEDRLGTFQFNDNEAFDLTIESAEGLSRDDVLLSGDHSTQVFNFNNTNNSTLIFKGVSVVDGNSTTDGGGVYTNHNIKIENCNISNNISNSYGGGFYSDSTTTVTNSTISNNISTGDDGGFSSKGSTIVKDSIISNNSAGRYNGGFGSYDTTNVINSTISKNKSNRATGGFGSMGTTVITNSSVSNNNSGKYGAFWSNETTKVVNSTISNNIANDVGGFNSNKKTTITNSTISNNIANNNVGGFSSNRKATITNSNISNNNAKYNSAFYSNGAIVTNSIFSENNATNGKIFSSSSSSSYSYSCISNNIFINNKGFIVATGIFVNNIFNNNGDTDIVLTGNSKIYNNYIDYNKIEENGHNVIKKQNLQPSSAGDVHLNSDNETLASDSPVIDNGLNPSSVTYKKIIDNDDIYNQMVQLLKTDKVGNRRVHNETIDMGAVEYGSSQ